MKNQNIEQIVRFCFNELSEEQQFQIECQLLRDDVLFETVSGVFRLKRKFGTKEKVLEYFRLAKQKARERLFS